MSTGVRTEQPVTAHHPVDTALPSDEGAQRTGVIITGGTATAVVYGAGPLAESHFLMWLSKAVREHLELSLRCTPTVCTIYLL